MGLAALPALAAVGARVILETQAAILALAAASGWLVALVALWLAFHSSRALLLLAAAVAKHNAAHSRGWCCDLERLLFTKVGPSLVTEQRRRHPRWPDPPVAP